MQDRSRLRIGVRWGVALLAVLGALLGAALLLAPHPSGAAAAVLQPSRATTTCVAPNPPPVVTPAFTPGPGCSAVPAPGVLSAVITDHPNTTTALFTNNSPTCSYPIGLAVYQKVDNSINHQILFDYALAVIPPHSSLTLTVNNPSCAYQGDAFYGSLIVSFAGGARYGERRLDDTDGVHTGFCPRSCPTATPTLPPPPPTGPPTIAPTRTPTNTPTNTAVVPTRTPTNTPTNTAVVPTRTPTNTPTNTAVVPTRTPMPPSATATCVPETPIVVVTPAFTPGPGGGCSATPPAGILEAIITDHPNTTSALFTNHSKTCSYPIGLATYRKVDNNIDHQILYDYALAVIPPNSTLTLTVNNPPCAYQSDAFWGNLIVSFAGGVRYGERLLDDTNGNGTNYCQVVCVTVTAAPAPSNTPTNTAVVPTRTPSNTPTNTAVVPTRTPSNTPTNTAVVPTRTPSNTPTNTAVVPTRTPTNTPTNTAVVPTATPTVTATAVFQGCSPGFWKNHPEAYPPPYTPATTLGSVFTLPACGSISSLAGTTFDQALNFGGGPTLLDAARILLRQGVAGVLNAAAGINYPLSQAQVISEVNTALASCDRTTILAEATRLNTFNNLFCPLPRPAAERAP